MGDVESQMEKMKHNDVCSLLKQKFDAERMEKFFIIDDKFTFSSNEILLDSDNSIFLQFNSTQNNLTPYNLLLILSLSEETIFSNSLRNQIRRISENNIDKIVIWIKKAIDAELVQSLKRCNANVICITNSEISDVSCISNFYPIGEDYNYVVILNKLTDLLVIRLKKLFHLVLSEIAASSYDDNYGVQKIGTKAIMDFEEEILKSTIKYMKWKKEEKSSLSIAVDVGCGTGRHSLRVLAPEFKSVHAFDFSPKMIEFAKLKKRNGNYSHIVFSTADLEYEQIMYQNEFVSKTDLIVASFGMGSFIEDTSSMLRRFHEWLCPGGTLFLSFYNANSVLLNLTPNWRDTSLSALIDVDSNTLQVELDKENVFQIFCKPYDNTIKTEITKMFDIREIYTFPTTLALLPNSLLQNKLAKKLFTKVDITLSKDQESFLGHYVIVVAHKPLSIDIDGYKNVISTLESKRAKYQILEHEVVLSINDVIDKLKVDNQNLIKSLVFYLPKDDSYVLIILPYKKRINKGQLAQQLKIAHNEVRFATEKEVIKLGFPLGGVAPFGYPDQIRIQYFIHPLLLKETDDPIYMGIGDNRKTLKLDFHSFKIIVKDYIELNQE